MTPAGSIDDIVIAFDRLDADERPKFSDAEDRAWLWAAQKKGRAEYYEQFDGIEAILRWILSAVEHERGGYLPEQIEGELVVQSRTFDFRALPELSKRIAQDKYDYFVGRWNAGDFFYPNAYPVPHRFRPKRVLDFGAGYGRQLNLWSQRVPGLVYAALDAIRRPYLSQSLYFQRSGLPVFEYVLDPSAFSISERPGVYHLPAWRWDLIPDNFFDVVLAIFVLPELHPATLKRTLAQFLRVLKPGGALFIRDHGLLIRGANNLDIADVLRKSGFVLEFRPYVRAQLNAADSTADIRGVPRIWRKQHPDIKVVDEPV